MEYLNDAEDRFSPLFLENKTLLHLNYDHIFRIQPKACKSYSPKLDFNNTEEWITTNAPQVLQTALGNRISLAVAVQEAGNIFIGVNVNPEVSLSGVIHGPSPTDPDEKKIADFQAAWGEKCELRRFKDGNIIYSVVFESNGTYESRAMIICDMISHLLKRWLGCSDVKVWGSQLFPFIAPPTCPSSFKSVTEDFANFCKILRDLDTPLKIAEIHPTSSGLLYTSPVIASPQSNARLGIQIQFESSSRWPDSITAIKAMKLAFQINIARQLKDHPDMVAAIVKNKEESSTIATTRSGYKYEIFIHAERECVLDETLFPFRVTRIKYASFIREECIKYPQVSSACRLLKRWIASHCLPIPSLVSDLICIEAIKFRTPGSAITAFTRTFSFISKFDWENEYIIVPVAESDDSMIRETFEKSRKDGAESFVYIASSLDQSCSLFKADWNQRQTIDRLVKLSKSALKFIANNFVKETNFATLFTPLKSSFDVLINLDSKFCTRALESLTFTPAKEFKNLKSKTAISLLDTVSEFVEECRVRLFN